MCRSNRSINSAERRGRGVFSQLRPARMNPLADGVFRSRKLGRVGDWWETKLVPAVSVLIATALVSGTDVPSLIAALAELIVTLTIGALFVSLLNDFTDREDDRRSGKPNSFEQHPTLGLVLLIGVIAGGAACLWWLSARPLAAAAFVLGWLAYLAYSVPPLRLKTMGLPGLLCDAVGAHVVPSLLAVALLSDPAQSAPLWWLAVAAWSVAWGVRGIVAHQLADEAQDRAAGVRTFVVRYGPHRVRWWIRRFVFPIELAGLLALLAQLPGVASLIALGLALVFELAKASRFEVRPVLTSPEPRGLPLLHDFYYLFMPLSLLAQLALSEPRALWLLPAYALLFHRHLLAFFSDAARLQKERLG